MDSLFLERAGGISVEFLCFMVFFLGVTIIRIANPRHIPYVIGLNILVRTQKKYDVSIFGKNDSKSSVFFNLAYIIFFSLLIHKLFHLTYIQSFLLGFGLYTFKLVCWYSINQFIGEKSEIPFLKNRLLINETLAFAIFFYLLLYTYLPHDIMYGFIYTFVVFVITLVRISSILTNYVSVFHNILYLCTLEILPIFVLVKLITKYIN